MTRRSVTWRDWGQKTFEEARADGRPLFLLVNDFWSEVSAGAPRLISEDPALSHLLDSSFIPVLSDADAKPEVASRYGGRDVPCACILHPDGNIITAFDRIDPREIHSVLRGISLSASSHKPGALQGLGRYPVPYLPAEDRNLERGTEMIESIRNRLVDRLRPERGDFGEGSGADGIAPLRFLLEYAREAGDTELSRQVVESFHALAHSDLYDSAGGGFFAFSDGTRLCTAKKLRCNADWLRFALLVSAEEEGRFALQLARSILHYLQAHLLLEGGAFAAGQREDRAYCGLSSEERRRVPQPPVQETVFAAPNAAAIRSLCAAWQVLGEKAYLDIALQCHGFLKANLMAPDGTVAHAYKNGPSGIGYLDDQVAVGNALLALYRSTLDPSFLEALRGGAQNIVRFYGNPAGAGFLDLRLRPEEGRVPCAPRLDPPLNARTAVFLALASAQLEEPSLAAPARTILSALMEEDIQDASELALVGSALLATLYPMSYFVAVTDGSEVQRSKVVDRIRAFGRPFSMIFHRQASSREAMQTLPQLTVHCANQREEIAVS